MYNIEPDQLFSEISFMGLECEILINDLTKKDKINAINPKKKLLN